MSESHSDALVFFGATGDLAYKKIFPALQAMVKRGHLDVPVIGVAKAGWNLDQLQGAGAATASRSTAASIGGLRQAVRPAALRRRRLQRPGDLPGPAQGTRRRPAAGALPGHPARAVRHGRGAARQVGLQPRAPASSSKSRSAATSPRRGHSTASCSATSTRRRSSASTTTWASGRCRTCSSSASPTPSSSRSGTATTSRACRSPWRRISACRAAARSTSRPAPSATWSRTTCSRSWPTWRWSRRSGPTASPSATRR